jgi:serine/threonine protein kinase
MQREAAQKVGSTLLGKWRLDALLGVGGMAAVYAATHRNGARGALKILHREQSADDNVRSRFLREGYIANKVEHPGAVRVLDDDVAEDGRAFLVMELLAGQPLNERAATMGGKLPLEEVLLATDQLLDVLAAAHDRAIIHRDVKPENVFLCDDGRVKVLDFGIARLREAEGERPELAMSTTHAGIPMGTPAFMSPEQARGRCDLVSPQSDIWSVGATLFTLLSAQLVHRERTVSEVLAATFLKPARSLGDAVPGAPRLVVALVDRALALRPEERWSDARAMQAALRDAYRRIIGVPIPVVLPVVHAGEGPRRSSTPPIETVPFILSSPPRRHTVGRSALAALGFVAGFAASACAVVGLRAATVHAMGAAATAVVEELPQEGGEPVRVAAPAAHLAKARAGVKVSVARPAAPPAPSAPPAQRPPRRGIAMTLDDPPRVARRPPQSSHSIVRDLERRR